MGARSPGNSSVCINLHAYNFTDEPQLREIWINLYFVDKPTIMHAGNWHRHDRWPRPSAAAGATSAGRTTARSAPTAASSSCSATVTCGRPRFAAWLNDELIYDSWDWLESVTFNYDSITTNPPIDPG